MRFLNTLGARGEESAVPPVLPAANEEALDANLPALGREREDICISHTAGVDRLTTLDKGRRAQPVTQDRGSFEVQIFSRLGHLRFEIGLHFGRFSSEEILRLPRQLGIVSCANPAHTRGRATLDLVEQTWAIPSVKKAIRTRP